MTVAERNERSARASSLTECERLHKALADDLAGTKNPMIRSSIKARLATLERVIGEKERIGYPQ